MRKYLLFTLLLSASWLSAQLSCENAIPVSEGITEVAGYTLPSSEDTDCYFGSPGDSTAWFKYTATTDTLLRITSGGFAGATNEDTRLSILNGDCGSLVCVDGDDDSGPGTSAQIDLQVAAGETFYIVFDNRYSDDPFNFQIEGLFVPPSVVSFERLDVNRVGSLRAAVDMNGDYLDDIVSISSENIHLQYQNPDGTFTEANVTTSPADHTPSWSLTAGDLNGDGVNDLIYGGGSGTTFMLSDGNGGFVEESPGIYIFCQRGNCVDIDNNGMLDLFMCHDVEPNVYFINEGDAGFLPIQGGLGDTPDGGNYGSIWIDYDNDGDQDLYIAKCRGGTSDANINQLHRNNGDGTFTEVGDSVNLADRIQTWSSAWGDFDNDGDMDVFVGASSLSGDDYHRLMRNDDGIFTDVSLGSGVEEIFNTSIENTTHDFNNDGYLDIFGAGNTMFINNGDMTFTATSVAASNGPIGDLNNDGFLDIINGFGFEETNVFLNQPNENNYLKINAVGTVSNTNGIGARVELYTAAGRQIRDVRSGDGFRYMSSLNVHFGVGEATEIDSVVVNWPSGLVDVIPGPQVNSTLTIVEGEMPSGLQTFKTELLNIYPNPARAVVNIPQALLVEGAQIDLFDQNGSLLLRQPLSDSAIAVGNLPAGTYLLVYRSRETIRLGKFVKR